VGHHTDPIKHSKDGPDVARRNIDNIDALRQ
jgi:hypothetical protein